eukprot:m.436534 g.436534  ORF g.436534 m.436534 type:complete len:144 (+) comp20270_c3_seq4:6831-7262(+)
MSPCAMVVTLGSNPASVTVTSVRPGVSQATIAPCSDLGLLGVRVRNRPLSLNTCNGEARANRAWSGTQERNERVIKSELTNPDEHNLQEYRVLAHACRALQNTTTPWRGVLRRQGRLELLLGSLSQQVPAQTEHLEPSAPISR